MIARFAEWRSASAVAGALVVSALASMVVACSDGGDAGGVPVASDAAFMVVESDGSRRAVDHLEALLELAAFEVVLPASLPEGVELQSAQLTLPDPRFESMAPFARARATPVLLSFRGPGEDAARGFAVMEYEAAGGSPTTIGDAGAIAFELPGAEGAQLLDLPLDGRRAQSGTSVVWRACGVDFALTAPGSDVMPREEVLDLAQAFITGCGS